MNVTPKEKQIQILMALVEGNSIRSTERMTGVHRDTIMRLMVRVGEGCQAVLDNRLRGLKCKRLQLDEIWTFVGKKQGRLSMAERRNTDLGDQYIFVAIDADTKLVPAFTVGRRDGTTTLKFMVDLQARLKIDPQAKLNSNGHPQITTDGFTPYIDAIDQLFGIDVHYAQLIKVYAAEHAGRGRYAPPKVSEVLSKIITGNPDHRFISTSYVERQNLTMRMHIRRLTRLTNAFSKKLRNLKAAVALHFAHYNFKRIHRTLKCTPAMEAGIADHVWEWEELVAC